MNSDFLFPNNAAFSESQSLLLPSQRNTAIVVLTIIVLVMIIPYTSVLKAAIFTSIPIIFHWMISSIFLMN